MDSQFKFWADFCPITYGAEVALGQKPQKKPLKEEMPEKPVVDKTTTPEKRPGEADENWKPPKLRRLKAFYIKN